MEKVLFIVGRGFLPIAKSEGFTPGEKGKLNPTGYHSPMTENHTIPSGMLIVTQEVELMQDNDPKHSNKLCQMYIKTKKEQHDLQLMS